MRQHTWKRFHGARGLYGIGETNGSIFRGRAKEFGPLSHRSARKLAMEAFLVSLSTVAIAEMGDRTQLLALVLASRYQKPWSIIAGILLATLANHAAVGIIGTAFGKYLSPTILDAAVGSSMLGACPFSRRDERKESGSALTHNVVTNRDHGRFHKFQFSRVSQTTWTHS